MSRARILPPDPVNLDVAVPALESLASSIAARQKKVLKPFHDRVLVRRIPPEEGFMAEPTSTKEQPAEGTVIAVGPGKTLQDGTVRPVCVKVGDRVVFAKYGGHDITIDHIVYTVLREDELVVGIEDAPLDPAATESGQ